MKIEYIEAVFQDEYSQPKKVYFPGQTVSGVLKFRVSEDFTVNKVTLTCKGKAHVEWEEDNVVDDDKSIHYDELYMEDVQYLIGSEYDKNFRQDLHVGEHTHNFTFKLKEDLPTSYESKHAYVRYFLCAQFFRPEWKKTDYKFKEPFTVVSIIDLNSEPNVLQPINSTDTDTVGCCCCAEGPVVSEFKLERSGYVPGEFINIRAEIDNRTSKQMSGSRVELWMKLKLIADDNKKTKQTKIAELRHGPTNAMAQDVWSRERLHIPACPPTMMFSSTLIQITYKLKFVGDIGFLGVLHEIPITIGTVPPTTVYSTNWGPVSTPFSAFSSTLTSGSIVNPADISLEPITAQPGLLPTAPPPSYQESLKFSGSIVTEKKEGQKKKKQFQPTYIYYNFGGDPQVAPDLT
ncbi:arrestin domain-containing protein 3-like [Crassostrea virginica]